MLPLVNPALAICILLLSAGCSDVVGGKPLVFQQGGEEGTKFAITFEQVTLQKHFPYLEKDFFHYRWHPELAPEGKMYVKILAKVKNLGPREMLPVLGAELKVDTGNVYSINQEAGLYVGPEEVGLQSDTVRSFGPGKEGWIFMYAEIPAETRPVEIFGQLGVQGRFMGITLGHGTEFRVSIPKSALSASSNPKNEKESAADTPQEDEIRRAFEWALEKYGQGEGKTYGPEWDYYEGCQKFVANAYGKPCPFYSYATPAEGARNLNAGASIGKSPPKGSWVFYSVKSDPRGHVALSVGEGLVIHAYTVKTQQKATVRKDAFDNVPGATYIGWAWPQRKK
jgi:hypothetical protein